MILKDYYYIHRLIFLDPWLQELNNIFDFRKIQHDSPLDKLKNQVHIFFCQAERNTLVTNNTIITVSSFIIKYIHLTKSKVSGSSLVSVK